MKNRNSLPKESNWPEIFAIIGVILLVALIVGIPVWIAGFWTGWALAAWVHLGLVVFFTLNLFFFGYDSCVEMGVLVTVIALIYAFVMPTFLRAKHNAEQRQNATHLRKEQR